MKYDTTNLDPFGILSSTKKVLQVAQSVAIDFKKLDEVSHQVKARLEKGLKEDEYELGLTGGYEEQCQLIFAQDAVNFCFWAEKDQEKWTVEYPKGNLVSGGWFGLVAAFKRARENNIPILKAEYLASLDTSKLQSIFESATTTRIPLIEYRLNNLIEVGEVLRRKFDGQFVNLLEEGKFDALKIVELTLRHFPSFRDETTYGGHKVSFLKRAQILANDLSFAKKNGKRLKIENTDQLTAFADYKIPQILRQFGVLKYSSGLAKKVDNYKIIPAFSSQEVEIRSATVWGVELIKNNLSGYTSSQIDNALWLISQDQSKVKNPYHRTYTTFY